MKPSYVNIHTHRPTHRGIELRAEGIHPWDADITPPGVLPVPAPDTQAIGEIGLDFACKVSRERQTDLFSRQLSLAEEVGLPVVLHCVKAFSETLALLRGRRLRAVIFHGFIGSPEQAAEAVRRGCHLSFGHRTFSSPRTMEALRRMPPERIFLETDDEQIDISEIYRRAAEVRGEDVETLKRVTTDNYERIFGNG